MTTSRNRPRRDAGALGRASRAVAGLAVCASLLSASAAAPATPESDDVLDPLYGLNRWQRSGVDRPPLLGRLWGDYRHYYSLENGIYHVVGFGFGAMFANTDIDQDISDWYQDRVRSSGTDAAASAFKTFGEWEIFLPTYLGLGILGNEHLFGKQLGPLGVWGERNARAIVLGVPPLLLMQRMTGGSRPTDGDGSSRWNFWNDSNGVSGHAFIGAVPFLTAGRMTKNVPLKILFYAASGLTAWSRVNDDAHYTSQAFLGWFMAWRAVRAVDASDEELRDRKVRFDVAPMGDGAFLMVSGRW